MSFYGPSSPVLPMSDLRWAFYLGYKTLYEFRLSHPAPRASGNDTLVGVIVAMDEKPREMTPDLWNEYLGYNEIARIRARKS